MDKSKLIAYIKGDLDQKGRDEVIKWSKESGENRLYLVRLNNLYISQTLPNKKATKEELERIYQKIEERETNALQSDEKEAMALRPVERKVDSQRERFRIRKQHFWGVAALMLLFLSTTLYLGVKLFNRGVVDEKIAIAKLTAPFDWGSKLADSSYLYTPRGAKSHLFLPDGSEVWLNSDSRISYRELPNSNLREVHLSGEAYFNVVSDPERIMRVSTDKNFFVDVFGTQFNIKAYSDDQLARTTLYSGKIILNRREENRIIQTEVKPFETIVIDEGKRVQTATLLRQERPEKEAAWRDNVMIFESTPLKEALKIVERWHGVDFLFGEGLDINQRITATFESESLVQIMELIRITSGISYKIEDNRVFLKK